MDTDLIEEARRTIIECGLSEPGQICGCSEEEIECLEKELEAKLPAMYRSFLKVMGKSAGRFMLGSDVFWNSLRKLRVWAKELLDECDISFALSDEVAYRAAHGLDQKRASRPNSIADF